VKILYDAHIFHVQRNGGISRYFRELINHLPERVEPIFHGLPRDSACFKGFTNPRWSARAQSRKARMIARLPGMRGLDTLMWADADIVHPTFYEQLPPLDLRRVRRGKIVVTVYDFIWRRYPSSWEGSAKALEDQKRCIEIADALICISQSTQDDLREFHPDCAARSRVIYPGMKVAKIDERLRSRAQHGMYVLFVGSRSHYKNFNFLLLVMQAVVGSQPDIGMIVAGPPFSVEEKACIDELQLGRTIRIVESPDDNAMAALYQDALCLAYPSSYEGFGFPPLEAMVHGTPALASRTSSLIEVAGDAGVLLPDRDLDAWANAIHRLAEDRVWRQMLIADGKAQASKFSWSECALQTAQLYDELAGDAP
jgi:glycosyltransferase involved in cell wall biosynthesis